MQLWKTVSLVVLSWMGVSFVLGCWYVFVGWRYATIDASYELPADYRLAFFSMSVLPVLIVILIVGLLVIARMDFVNGKAKVDSGTSCEAHRPRRFLLSSLGLAASLTMLGIILHLFSAQNVPYETAAEFMFDNPKVAAAMPDLVTVKLVRCTPHYLGWSSSLSCEFDARGLKHTGAFDVRVVYDSGKWKVVDATFRPRNGPA
jgi:hypothetical protein